MTVTNSTISGNTGASGGGFANGAFNSGSISTFDSSTISDNTSPGGGIANYNNNTLTLNNTIVANSISDGCRGRANFDNECISQAISIYAAGRNSQ